MTTQCPFSKIYLLCLLPSVLHFLPFFFSSISNRRKDMRPKFRQSVRYPKKYYSYSIFSYLNRLPIYRETRQKAWNVLKIILLIDIEWVIIIPNLIPHNGGAMLYVKCIPTCFPPSEIALRVDIELPRALAGSGIRAIDSIISPLLFISSF